MLEIETSIELGRREALANVLVLPEQVPKRSLALKSAHGVALHHLVSLLTPEALLDESQHDGLAEEQALRALQVSLQAFGIDHESLYQAGSALEHETERGRGI